MPAIQNPNIIFDRQAYLKIMHWVAKSPVEVSGLGKVHIKDDGSFIVREVMLLPQKNTSGSTDIEAEDVTRAMFELKDTEGHLNFWWHSHVNMAAFWSGTDLDTIQKFGNGGWVLASVFNKKYEQKNAVFFSQIPMGEGVPPLKVLLEDIPSRIVDYLPQATFDRWDAEYTKNIKETPVYPLPSYQARDLHAYWREKKVPTKWEIERGHVFWFDGTRWWKRLFDKDGKETAMVLGYPEWLSFYEQKEQDRLQDQHSLDGVDDEGWKEALANMGYDPDESDHETREFWKNYLRGSHD